MATRTYEKYMKFSIYLLVLVLLNLAGLTLFFRWDLTSNRIYSLSPTSKQVVATLQEPLTIKVFFTKNLPAPYNNTERYLHDLLEEYALHANRNFNYRFYDVSPQEGDVGLQAGENQQQATDYGINPVQIQAIEEDEVKFKRAYMGLALIHGDMVEQIPTITSIDGLEYKLTTAIQKLNNKTSAFLNLKDNIQVTLFLSSSLKGVAQYMGLDELPSFAERLEGIIKQVNAKTYNKLNYRHIDPSRDPDGVEAAKQYNIMTINWPAIPEANLAPGNGVIGLVMAYGDKTVTTPLLNVLRLPIIGTQYQMVGIDEMEGLINDNLEALVDINENLGYPGQQRHPGAGPDAGPAEQRYPAQLYDIGVGQLFPPTHRAPGQAHPGEPAQPDHRTAHRAFLGLRPLPDRPGPDARHQFGPAPGQFHGTRAGSPPDRLYAGPLLRAGGYRSGKIAGNLRGQDYAVDGAG